MKTKAPAHGPTVAAYKRAKHEAKQARLQAQEREAPAWTSWFDGREGYAAHVTVDDVRAIRRLRAGEDDAEDGAKGDLADAARLTRISKWIEPFFDLKETPTATDEGGRRLFVSEGTEAVRMMVQRCQTTRATSSAPPESTHPSNHAPRPPVQILSILSKPAPFFDEPTRLLGDVEQRFLTKGLSPPPFRIIIASEDALSAIAGFPIARGGMACGVVPTLHDAHAWLQHLLLPTVPNSIPTPMQSPKRRLLALDAVSNASNVGSILRTAAAFGVDAVILSDDSCDAWYRQSVRVSLGHVVNVPIVRAAELKSGLAQNRDDGGGGDGEGGEKCQLDGLRGVLGWLRRQNVECLAAVVDDNKEDESLPPLVALEKYPTPEDRSWCCVLGNEGHGIRDEVIRACDKRIKIGMASGVDSLSLPVAAGILMHGLST